VAITENIVMLRLDSGDVQELVQNLQKMGVFVSPPKLEKKLTIQLLPVETTWTLPIIEIKSTGVRSHNCKASHHENTPSTWSCDCKYHPLDQKFLTVSSEAQKLFGYSEEELMSLCDSDKSPVPYSIWDLYAAIIHEDDYEIFCKMASEAILDSEGRSLTKRIRCVNQKESSVTHCIARLRLSKSENYSDNTWNHYSNYCFFPL
jgi:hypothetical protein